MTTDLTLHRVLRAPRPLVWQSWTRPDLVKQWFCPKPNFVAEAEIDLRPGGRFFTLMNVDGALYPNDGSILEVVPEERLVFTDLLLADYQPVAEPGLGFTASLTFRDHPDGTEYVAVVRHGTAEARNAHEAMGFHDGWGTAATQLETLAASLAGGETQAEDRTLTISRYLKATPEAVWAAWTDPEVLPRWFGPDGYTCTTKEIDLRDGGVWRFDMIGHGRTFPNRHRDLRYDRPRRIAFLLDDDSDNGPASQVVVTLEPEDGGTRLTQVMTLPSAEAKAVAVGFGAEKLGQQTLARLAAAVEG